MICIYYPTSGECCFHSMVGMVSPGTVQCCRAREKLCKFRRLLEEPTGTPPQSGSPPALEAFLPVASTCTSSFLSAQGNIHRDEQKTEPGTEVGFLLGISCQFKVYSHNLFPSTALEVTLDLNPKTHVALQIIQPHSSTSIKQNV